MLKLEAKKRETKENLQEMRKAGIIPAVFYGPKEDSQAIKFTDGEFRKIFKEAGESTVISLSVEGEEHDVLIHAVDRHPVKDLFDHVDFYVIEKGKKVTVHVPILFEGESIAEKAGLMLVKIMHEVEIEAMPKDLPHELVIDISDLSEVGQQILVKDISIGEGVEFKAELDEPVVVIQEAKEEEIDEPVESPDMDSIEVEGEKKEGDDSSEDSGKEGGDSKGVDSGDKKES